MRVLQALPALCSGGVERGTVEFASDLVKRGHESFVVSSGGPMTHSLEARGSTHITRSIHRKSPASFAQVLPMRRLLRELQPDIVHVRSRMPAWIVWLAWRGLKPRHRPALVSSYHGMYSVNAYSAVMARAQHVIAVSDCVREYVAQNFHVPAEKMTVIQRGVDVDSFQQRSLEQSWVTSFYTEFPELADKRLIMMPGRISRWKGHLLFLDVMARLKKQLPACHGIIVGGVEPGKDRFMKELLARRKELGLEDTISFLGQRDDIAELYQLASLVCHLSTKPEPFGRTVTEALASGTPVAAFNRGGAAETLQACFPDGLAPPDDTENFTRTAMALLGQPAPVITIPRRFRLEAQTESTLQIYDGLLASRQAR